MVLCVYADCSCRNKNIYEEAEMINKLRNRIKCAYRCLVGKGVIAHANLKGIIVPYQAPNSLFMHSCHFTDGWWIMGSSRAKSWYATKSNYPAILLVDDAGLI